MWSNSLVAFGKCTSHPVLWYSLFNVGTRTLLVPMTSLSAV